MLYSEGVVSLMEERNYFREEAARLQRELEAAQNARDTARLAADAFERQLGAANAALAQPKSATP